MESTDNYDIQQVSVVIRACPAASTKKSSESVAAKRRASTSEAQQGNARKRSDSKTSFEAHVRITSDTTLSLVKASSTASTEYTFDRIYNAEASQADVFDGCVENCVTDVIHGHNVTVLVTGAIGAGKTYTMMGPKYIQRQKLLLLRHGSRRPIDSNMITNTPTPTKTQAAEDDADSAGLIPRALHSVYSHITNALKEDDSADFFIELSFVELNSHGFRDLLDDYRNRLYSRLRNNANNNNNNDKCSGGNSNDSNSNASARESLDDITDGDPVSMGAESLINTRRSMVTPTSGGSSIGGFSSFRISNETPTRSNSNAAFDSAAYLTAALEESDDPQRGKSSNAKGAGSRTRDPHMVRDIIDVHESPELGVFLSRPGGSVRIPAASEDEALQMLAAGCKARTSRVVGAEGHLSSR